jgi:hypothetical protein
MRAKPLETISVQDYLPLGRTQGGALIHIYSELAQHRGQMEICRGKEPERARAIISEHGQHAALHALGSKRAARAFLTESDSD